MTKYVNKIEDNSTSDVIYVEEYNKLMRGKKVVFIGDSTVNQMTQAELNLMQEAMPDSTITKTAVAATWADMYNVARSYSGTADVFVLICGSNDILNNNVVALNCGAPDIGTRGGDPAGTGAFNYMKLTLDWMRSAYPRAQIFCLQRADHPQRRRSLWYYFKYFEAAIMKEYGVPVIDLNDVVNLTNWNDAQKALYVQSDNLHYTHEMYVRLLTTLGYMLESNVTPSDMEVPSCYYVPESVLVDPSDVYAPVNFAACVDWIFQHCYTRGGGNQGQFIAGGAIVPNPGTNSTVFFMFEGNGSYSADMLIYQGCRAIIKRPDHLFWMESDGTSFNVNTVIMTESFFDTSNPIDIRALPEGDYVFLSAVASVSTGFPAGNTDGGHLVVRRNKTAAGVEGGNGLFMFHAYQSNKLYIGTNVSAGNILWAEMAKV